MIYTLTSMKLMKILFVWEMSLCAFVIGFSLPAAAAEPVVKMRHTEKQPCDSCCCSFLSLCFAVLVLHHFEGKGIVFTSL